ncbi:MAG: hypothetical protein AVDCRST_MAG26-297 [uncultured Chloroflexia bacterium]|uniref:Uncharacterized protein n=1 Tax=uncultured Chloroflexia bacterium TaxID=1672391 RepID=A0A6J4H6Y8_9CHLR|nr:MAG: hypothetical protein AVDCRST_MAG26-297 [uncultured Chloroflexia bacterium]
MKLVKLVTPRRFQRIGKRNLRCHAGVISVTGVTPALSVSRVSPF